MPADLKDGRIVIAGASLAGLRAAKALREEGFPGSLTVAGDEPCAHCDRPPLSSQALLGQATADTTELPMHKDLPGGMNEGPPGPECRRANRLPFDAGIGTSNRWQHQS
ncbi:hypothetical protein [Streptomyces adustus]|uniref:hypothetical protein n=1 Tax=Streptomyces adustus TaxID=1609272 RepID=UPI00371A33A2